MIVDWGLGQFVGGAGGGEESPDFRSPEVGISETIAWSVTGYEPVSPKKPCSYSYE